MRLPVHFSDLAQTNLGCRPSRWLACAVHADGVQGLPGCGLEAFEAFEALPIHSRFLRSTLRLHRNPKTRAAH